MFIRPNWFILVPAAVAAVCLALLLAGRGDDPTDDTAQREPDEAANRLASEAAMRQIARESEAAATTGPGAQPAPQAAAPPGFQPAPVAEREPTPPAGYSFSSYREAVRVPLTDADRDSLRKPSPAPGWMGGGVDALAGQAAAQGRDWTFGWVKLARGAEAGDLAGTLAARGGAAIGQAGDMVRARLPADRESLRAIAAAGAVAGIGAVPPAEKIAGTLAERALADASARAPVWITLMDDDPDGAWRRGLEGRGAVVGRFDPAVRAYAATVPLAALESISRADYVLAVESIGRVAPALAVATSVTGADAMRSHDADTGLFGGVGGASVPIGVMDSGLNVGHVDIASNRRSICGANFVARLNEREENQDLWFDFGGHGTWVTGVVAGSGTSTPLRAGMAPLVRDIRIAKASGSFGHASTLNWARALDWLAKPTACGNDMPRKPLVVNSSLGATADYWESRGYVERKIDATVWSARQVFVTSAGNSAQAGYSSMAGAKNALVVGATRHGGDIIGFTSRGPTRDGRLLPKVVGPGVDIEMPDGNGARTEYVSESGTSFSSPAVAGVAALLMDAVPDLREEPAAVRARLMASAVKPDAFLGAAAAFAPDNTRGPGPLQHAYGLGKVSARTAILNRDAGDGWTGGSTAFDVDPDGYVSHEIVVPEGAGRLEVVLTWDEPPADTITDSVLHDLDLWVDWQGSCGAIPACGEFHSLSAVDNVEWVVVPDPRPGVYRVKVTPARVVGAPPRAGLAWTVIRGPSTPRLGVEANVDRIDVGPGEPFEVEVALTADGYVAAGASLRVDCRAEAGSDACDGLVYQEEEGGESVVRREDAVDRPLEPTAFLIDVGEIGPDERQVVALRFPGREAAGSFRLYLAASAWNADSGATSVAVVVGDPGAASPEPVRRPPNDDYGSPTVLAGDGGETTFDLVAATPDPGEPPYPLLSGEPLQRERSLWYLWTAPDHGPVRFTILQSHVDDYSDFPIIEVFPDGPRASIEAIGTGQIGGGTAFHAERGETYRIRLTIHPAHLTHTTQDDEGNNVERPANTPRLTMTWGPAGMPENDHFAHAAVIEGGTGSLVGSNQAATTEPGELVGVGNPYSPSSHFGWDASVWHRWVAPASGDWRFAVNRRVLAVGVFTGDGVADARLMSGVTGATSPDEAVFPATEGVEYRVAVASKSAYFSGTEFTLSWEPGARDEPGNDDFAAAVPVADTASTSLNFDDLTVEHGEPAESGVRTAWYVWDPRPTAGRVTWEAEYLAFTRNPPNLGDIPLRMSVFKGAELAALEPVATNADAIEMRMAFDAEAGEPYAFALGLPGNASHALSLPVEIAMRWGPTPENDDRANATVLTEISGSVAGSNEFATIEPHELTGELGDSSLWWSLEPTEAGWMRFVVDGLGGVKLAVYRMGDDGSLELLGTSRPQAPSVNFKTEAGVRYYIRLGSYIWDADGFGGWNRGPFELSWGPGGAPVRLRFVETVPDFPGRGWRPDDDAEIQFDGLGAQAFNADGTELYVASRAGIVVLERDAGTGKLTPGRTLAEHPIEDPGVQLLWDDAGGALLVASCDGWTRFTPAEGGGIEYAGAVEGGPCPEEPLLMHGPFVHNVLPSFMIETFRFDDGRTALTSVDQVMVDGVAKAAMAADGSHVYAVTAGDGDGVAAPSLLVFERDAETGSLDLVSTLAEGGDGKVDAGFASVAGLAVHASHLFVSSGGGDTAVFALADPATPAFVARQDSILADPYPPPNCGYLLARPDVAAVDVACDMSNNVYTAQVAGNHWVFSADVLFMDGRERDSFDTVLPDNSHVRSFIASPDGRHLYVAGAYDWRVYGPFDSGTADQIVVFERRLGD